MKKIKVKYGFKQEKILSILVELTKIMKQWQLSKILLLKFITRYYIY